MRWTPERRYLLALLAISIALWLPRLTGPLDFRYDAGVYYLLGSSLAQGSGYRILSEPGALQAIQYPPVLAAIGAAWERLLGTDDPAVVGHWLRLMFFGLFMAYGAAVFALARRLLPAGYAFLVGLVTLLHIHTIFMSDLWFADFPYAVIASLFLLAAAGAERDRRRVWVAATLGLIAFGLRTAGVALAGAWAAESVLARRYRQALLRFALVLLPMFAWQAYVSGVKASPEYHQPAYPYQRAAYQFYNVGYLENLAYVDPFRPELGHLSIGDLARRVASNIGYLPVSLGEAVSGDHGWWRRHIRKLNQWAGTKLVPGRLAYVPILILSALVGAGVGLLAFRRQHLLTLYILASIGLIVLTPWRGQFARYLAPLTPLLALALMSLLAAAIGWSARLRGPRRTAVRLGALAVLAMIVPQQLFAVHKLYQRFHQPATYWSAGGERREYRLFFHDSTWTLHEGALDWIRAHGRPEEIVATSTPHWAYLRTGLKAVMPPFELDGATAQRLLDAVPVSYLVTDSLDFVDVGRRYTAPVLRAFPGEWELVYRGSPGGSRVYRRVSKSSPVLGSK